MEKYVILEKEVGETPLSCAEAWREAKPPSYQNVPLAYAGRLDPMASGKLLILIGDECKVQEKYHGLDKEYEFSVLFGVGSDTGDVLGLLIIDDNETGDSGTTGAEVTESNLRKTASSLIGNIEFPYPHFSSKTVRGKPLHVWTLEGRLDEITIPTKKSRIHSLNLIKTESKTRQEIYIEVIQKIETIPPVTEASKALGNDFRRVDVRADWQHYLESGHKGDTFTIATFRCIASSGSYMRSLAEVIAKAYNTNGLAYHIHRTQIGKYQPLISSFGFWWRQF
jgi:tRNA pseudouridine(55) synthase